MTRRERSVPVGEVTEGLVASVRVGGIFSFVVGVCHGKSHWLNPHLCNFL